MQNFELNSPPPEVYAGDLELEIVSSDVHYAYNRPARYMADWTEIVKANRRQSYNYYQETNLQTSYD
jgi:hypothetical protein